MESTQSVRVIDSFTGEHAFLSNFFVEPDGDTVEHYYQAFKTDDHKAMKRILNAPTASAAKKLGRKVELHADWEEIKEDVMLHLLRAKFKDEDLAQKLLDTGDAELVEGNKWGDTYWGVCRGKGKNRLGELLMQVRSELESDA
jgi:ribA/ribD-fused uncharacterized protein